MVRRLAKLMLIFAGLVVAAALGLWLFMNHESGNRWAQEAIRKRFPDVSTVSVAELNRWMHDTSRQPPVILDVRTAEEQAVSTLPGAVPVSPDAPTDAVLKNVDRRRPVVVYCAAGYRGAVMARRLSQAGCADVRNLEGGIFAWANADLPLEKDGLPAEKVHPYSSLFARMLKNRN